MLRNLIGTSALSLGKEYNRLAYTGRGYDITGSIHAFVFGVSFAYKSSFYNRDVTLDSS